MKSSGVSRPESHVVSEGQRVERRNTSKPNQKGVVGQREEEGGERATLLNPPLDEDPDVGGTPKDWINPRAVRREPIIVTNQCGKPISASSSKM